MSASYLGFAFDEEIFNRRWDDEPDTVLSAMIGSGAVVQDATIAGLVAQGGDRYTVPFYNILDASTDDQNYDGKTDIVATEHSSDACTGVVFGRSKAWFARDFVGDISQDDPMVNIVKKVAGWWQKKDQMRLIGILNAIFGITGDEDWKSHTMNLATSGASVTDENKVGVSTLNNAIQQANGDNKGAYSLAIMHSAIANRLANLQLLEYWKYNDANGVQRPMNLASVNGLTVVIDDGVPVKASSSATGNSEYTTYLFGSGFIRTANAPVDVPSEVNRDPARYGGMDTLYTRQRKTFHPNGFSYIIPTDGYTQSPTDEQLFASARWEIKYPAKSVPAARLITNG